MIELTDMQKLGLGSLMLGSAFLMLGILLFFDKGLLAFGNILLLCGLCLFIGVDKTFRLFFQRHKIKGTCLFFSGIAVVMFGFPIIGMLIETYGAFCLFSGFLPIIIGFLYRLPVIGWILCLPGINKVTHYLSGQSKSIV